MSDKIYLPPSLNVFLLKNSNNKQVLLIRGGLLIHKLILPSFVRCTIENDTNLVIFSSSFLKVSREDILILCRRIETCFLQAAVPFSLKIILSGVGYKFIPARHSEYLLLHAGFSHLKAIVRPFRVQIKMLTEKGNSLKLKGPDKNQITQFAQLLRNLRIPDSYKGKGVRLQTDKLRLKEGKKQK
jgi:ribosomal protein L6P/L9E